MFDQFLKTPLQAATKRCSKVKNKTMESCQTSDVFKRLEDVFARRFENVLKTYGQDECVGLDQDVLKTSSEDV